MDFQVCSFKDIKEQIKYKGYMTGTQIYMQLSDKEKKEVIKSLIDDPEIHKIEYTNRYVAPYTTKQLYFYNPNIKKKKRRKKSKSGA